MRVVGQVGAKRTCIRLILNCDQRTFPINYVLADPNQVSENSNTTVWWTCQKNPEHGNYPMAVSTRVLFKLRKRIACPMCRGRRRRKRHFV